jgi:ATP-binding cassette subfamily B protein
VQGGNTPLSVIKYLFESKRTVATLIIIIGFLVLQVVCDLSLPKYTSNIVDVGIMQGGIEGATPTEIRKESLADLELFMPESDIKIIKESYRESNDSATFILKDSASDNASTAKLDKVFSVPMTILASSEMQGDAATASSELDVNKLRAGYYAGAVTKEQLLEIRKTAEDKIDSLGELMTDSAAIAYLQSEYKAMGKDMKEIQMDYMKDMGLRMILYTLGSAMSAIVVCFLASFTAAAISQKLRKRIYYKTLGFSMRETDHFTAASLITRSTNDIQQIQMALVLLMRIVLLAPIMGIGGIIMVAGTESGLGWIVIVAVAFLLVVMIGLIRITMPKFKMLQTLIDKLNLITREILSGLPVIRAFCREDYETKRFEKANDILMKTQLFTNRAMSMMFPFMMLIMNGISLTVVWFGAKSIDAGNLQVGDMMAFITYTIMIVMSFMMISMIAVFLPRANVAAERVNEVFAMPLSVTDKPSSELIHKDSKDWRGEVEFNNVSFRFPDAEEDVLTDINFTATPGETTAIIGSTGSGKTTLINLIPRMFDVTSGSITIDGTDVRDLSQHDLRALLGVVPQKGVLFSGDIASNIKFADEEKISDSDMKRAADIAQATEFIDAKDEQYESHISQGGTNVSGGQKQRLSIARAIAKDPKIFIFDDSFSALDFKTDKTLRKALANALDDRTIIIVAQRISTILGADKIVVLDEGEIAGIGTHKELLKTCEVYHEIAASQLSEQELAG